jgi:hypothetical protein
MSQRRWVVSFILNGSLRAPVTMDDDTRRTLYSFLRRTEAAFQEYEEARRLTLEHLADQRPISVSRYIKAVGHWEQFLSQTYQAWTVLVRGQKILFVNGDGSVFERLNLLYGRTKHLEKAINSGQLPPRGTLPVWLTNDGLHALDAELTFIEMAEILTDLAKWADAAQDPLTMRETISASYGLSEDD